MKRELADAVRARLKKQVMDGILAANPLDLPKTLVDAQVRELQIDAARRMGAHDASQIPPPDAFQDAARRRVALTLLISEVVKQAVCSVDQSQVQARFEELAQQFPDADAGAADVPQQSADPASDGSARCWKIRLSTGCWSAPTSTDQPSTFKELMNFGA